MASMPPLTSHTHRGMEDIPPEACHTMERAPLLVYFFYNIYGFVATLDLMQYGAEFQNLKASLYFILWKVGDIPIPYSILLYDWTRKRDADP